MASSAHRENLAMALDTRMELVKWERGKCVGGKGDFRKLGGGGGTWDGDTPKKYQRNYAHRILS